MSTDGEFYIPKSEMLDIANAMAKRSEKPFEILDRVISRIFFGYPYDDDLEVPEDVRSQRLANLTTLHLARLRGISGAADLEDTEGAFYSEIDSKEQEDHSATGKDYMWQEPTELTIASSFFAEDVINKKDVQDDAVLRGAVAKAAELGVSTADIYLENDLLYPLIAKVVVAADQRDTALEIVRAIDSAKSLLKLAKIASEQIKGSRMPKTELLEAAKEVLSVLFFRVMFREIIEYLQESYRQVFCYETIMVYGSDVYTEIVVDNRELVPRKRFVPLILPLLTDDRALHILRNSLDEPDTGHNPRRIFYIP